MRACLENKTVLKDCQICWKLRMGPHAAPITSYSQLKIPFSITKPSEKNFFFFAGAAAAFFDPQLSPMHWPAAGLHSHG